MRKKIALIAAVFSFIYLFIPEPTDLIPILGWLDEATALAILVWALKTLGLNPFALLRKKL